MWVLVAGVDLEFREDLTSEAVVRDHALDCHFDDALRLACAEFGDGVDLFTTDVAGVADVLLLLFFFTGENHLLGVDDHNEIAGVDVWCEDCLVLAAQEAGCGHSHLTEDFTLGVDDVPFTVDFLCLR